MSKTKFIISSLFALVFLLIGIIAVPTFGANWDEPIHFGRGQAILHFFLTGEKDYKNFESKPPTRRSFYQSDGYTYEYLEKNFNAKSNFIIGAGHPVISDVLASVTNRIVYGILGVLGDIESYHLYSIVLSAILVGCIVYFTYTFYGFFAAFVAGLSLVLYPLFLGESRFNIKDPPESVYYSLTAITFFLGVIKNNWKWILASSVFAGLAFGTKLNIVFLSVSLLLWQCIYWGSFVKSSSIKRLIQKHKKIIVVLFLFPIIPFILYFLSWPMLWEDPISRFLYNLSYYKTVGIRSLPPDPQFLLFGINTYALQWIFFTTPPVTLIFSILGIMWALVFGFKEKYRTSLFVLLWFAVPILRVMSPGADIYGGVRQIMEYIPPIAILSGIGASYIVVLFKGVLKKQSNNGTMKQFGGIASVIILLLFIPIFVNILKMYPHESIYFNSFIGGLKGAKEKDIPGWGNSLGSTYRSGVLWINKHAEQKAKLATVYELRSNVALSDLRSDIEFYNQLRSSILRKGEYIIGVTHGGTFGGRFHREYLERFLNPVYELNVDGVSVLKVWKNDLAHTKDEYKKKDTQIFNFSVIKAGNLLRIDLKQVTPVTRVYIHYNSNNCTLPANGYFEYSRGGNFWKRETGDFTTGTRIMLSEKGVLRYLFPARKARFFQAVISDTDSCLLNGETKVEVYTL